MTAYNVFGERQFTTHVFNSVWAEHNPELVEAFVSAVADAAEWIEQNQTAAREIISQYTGVDVRYIENYYFQPNARVNIDDAAFWLEYMRHIGLVTADWLTVEDFATNRFNLREGG
jgi:ABC-type nitrate/sulfonate/bicarbonate transport system substrate-binding protein